MSPRIAVVSAGPSRSRTWNPEKSARYWQVIAVNAACLDTEADWFCLLDEGMLDRIAISGAKPRRGWIACSGLRTPPYKGSVGPSLVKYEKIVSQFHERDSCRWSFPIALYEAARMNRSAAIDVFGYDHTVDKAHPMQRWDRERKWIYKVWTDRFRRIRQPGA